MNINKCIIIGKVGNIQEPRQTKAGHTQIRFSVSVSKKVKGEWESQWFTCSLFNKSAESFAKYYVKGDVIYCEGSVSANAYTAKDGTLKADLSLMVNEFHKIQSSQAKQESKPEFGMVKAPTFDRYAAFVTEFTEDDIPF